MCRKYHPLFPGFNSKIISIGRHTSFMKLSTYEVEGKTVAVGSLSSYYKALEVAHLLADEIRRGDFQLTKPIAALPKETSMKPLVKREETL